MSFKTIPEMFFQNCKRFSEQKVAFRHKKEGVYTDVTYGELKLRVECFALGLLNLGIKPKDRIGLVSENRVEWAIADLAITALGAVDVPVFPTLTSKQEEYIFGDCGVSAVIASSNFQLSKILEFKYRLPTLRHIIVMNDEYDTRDVAVMSMSYLTERGCELKTAEERSFIIEEMWAKVLPEDILTLIYTSGTTGNPKGVILTHNNVVSNILASIEVVNISETDRFLSYLPWCHSFERTTGYYAAFSQGAVIAFAEAIESVGVNIKETHPNLMTTVPRFLETVMKKILAGALLMPPGKRKLFEWAVTTGRNFIKAKYSGGAGLLLNYKYRIADKLVFSKLREKIGIPYI